MVTKELANAASKIHELSYSLENLAKDDEVGLWHLSYDDEIVLREARYVLDTFREEGHANNDQLTGRWEDDKQQRASARRQVRQLESLIKKFGSQLKDAANSAV
jgi:hypothetical protein